MNIAKWPLWGKLAAFGSVLTILGGLWANAIAIAESDAQPFALKYQVAAQTQAVIEGLNQIQWNQAIERFNNLEFQLGHLATQQIMLSDAVKREPEDVLKRVRLQEMDGDIAAKKAARAKLKCQIEARNNAAPCP